MSDYITKWGQETNLYQQAQAGDEDSLAELMRMHEGLVHYVMRQQWRGDLSYEEGIHAGRIGLWRSILGYGQCGHQATSMACGQRNRTGEKEGDEVGGSHAVICYSSKGRGMGSQSDVVRDGWATAGQAAVGGQLLLWVGRVGRKDTGSTGRAAWM